MKNPIYEQYRGTPNNVTNIMNQFQQFRNTFRGDPKQQVQQLLNSGRVSQEQYNRAVQMANQFMKYMK